MSESSSHTGAPGAPGVFRARSTRDATAIARDGERYVAFNPLAETQPSVDSLFEIQFADGIWMLARRSDLDSESPDPCERTVR